MDYSTLTDETLMLLIARGQTDALGVFYDRYSRLVFSLALNIVGDQPTAEEITLDVFTRIWEKAGTYRAERAKVTTWLTSITRNHSISMLRRRGSRPEQHSLSWTEVSPEVAPTVSQPEAMVELSLQRARVQAAIAELPVDQQQALALAFFNGYTHRQIAEALNQPLGTIKTRIRMALKKLRQTLRDESDLIR